MDNTMVMIPILPTLVSGTVHSNLNASRWTNHSCESRLCQIENPWKIQKKQNTNILSGEHLSHYTSRFLSMFKWPNPWIPWVCDSPKSWAMERRKDRFWSTNSWSQIAIREFESPIYEYGPFSLGQLLNGAKGSFAGFIALEPAIKNDHRTTTGQGWNSKSQMIHGTGIFPGYIIYHKFKPFT